MASKEISSPRVPVVTFPQGTSPPRNGHEKCGLMLFHMVSTWFFIRRICAILFSIWFLIWFHRDDGMILGYNMMLPSDCYKKLLKMAMEIVGVPIKHGDFPWSFCQPLLEGRYPELVHEDAGLHLAS